MLFNNHVKFGNVLALKPNQDEIRHIPQFFRASADYAYRLGGEHIRGIIDALPLSPGFKYISIDVRVHMLMPGWLPCIGGWHCDDFYRPTEKQPDLNSIVKDNKYCKHHTIVFGPVAMTEFAVTPITLYVPTDEELKGANLYGFFNKKLNDFIEKKAIETKRCTDGQMISFDSFDFHRGMESEGSGWRMFLRATESNHWEPKNEIRTQTQVYLKDFGQGW